MANRPAGALGLRADDRQELAQRARIVLLAAEGAWNTRIAELVGGVSADGDWLAGPVCRSGLAGLDDQARSGGLGTSTIGRSCRPRCGRRRAGMG